MPANASRNVACPASAKADTSSLLLSWRQGRMKIVSCIATKILGASTAARASTIRRSLVERHAFFLRSLAHLLATLGTNFVAVREHLVVVHHRFEARSLGLGHDAVTANVLAVAVELFGIAGLSDRCIGGSRQRH